MRFSTGLSFAAILGLFLAACHSGDGTGAGGSGGSGGSGPPPPVCTAGCPAGYTCEDGVCTGGNAQAIDFDIKTFPVSGKLRVDGAVPQGNGCAYDQVRLDFKGGPEPEHIWDSPLGSSVSFSIPCTTGDGSFSGRLPAGTYRVIASRPSTEASFPDGYFVVDPAFTVSGPAEGLQWDLGTVPISGKITVAGAAPKGNGCAYDQVRLDLVDDAGASFSATVPCTTADGSFTARVAPGTYRVIASRPSSEASFPDGYFVVDPAFTVSGPKSGIKWDVTTVPVSGKITVAGVAPKGNGCAYDQVRIDFVDTRGASFSATVPCTTGDGSFTGHIAPGTYRVVASRPSSEASFPDGYFVLDPSFTVSGAKSGIKWDVTTVPISGKITVEGQSPKGNGCAYDQVRIDFVNDSGASFSASVPCTTGDGSFTGHVAPGTYRVIASRPSSEASFPDGYFVLDPSFTVSGAKSGVAWNVTTIPVAGHIRVDGQPPQGNGCAYDQVRIDLLAPAGGSFSATVPCTTADGAFTGRAAPGIYRFLASGPSSESSFPDGYYNLQDAIKVP
ncbi:MAG: hypothetical protein QM820_39095 [Minicystis sp.]